MRQALAAIAEMGVAGEVVISDNGVGMNRETLVALQLEDLSAIPQVEEIAKTKMPDLNASDLDAAVRIVLGTARSMGMEVVEA